MQKEMSTFSPKQIEKAEAQPQEGAQMHIPTKHA